MSDVITLRDNQKTKKVKLDLTGGEERDWQVDKKELDPLLKLLQARLVAARQKAAATVLPPRVPSPDLPKPPPVIAPSPAAVAARKTSVSAPPPAPVPVRQPSPPPTRAAQPAQSAIALYDHTPGSDEEVAIREGEKLTVLDTSDPDWFTVRTDDGREGIVPATYVEIGGKAVEEQKPALPSRREPSATPVFATPAASSATERDTSSESRLDLHSGVGSDKLLLLEPDPAKIRTFTDRTGTFRVEAEFLGVVDGKAHLHKTNGNKIFVPLEKLSDEDKAFVEGGQARQTSAPPPPPSLSIAPPPPPPPAPQLPARAPAAQVSAPGPALPARAPAASLPPREEKKELSPQEIVEMDDRMAQEMQVSQERSDCSESI